ncbi:hypothetical protein [Dactylosporangium sp. NPDC000521]|uniref:hypothetical protein n=1 Tax=Dactylosporangium sp. NPDC000521 TaxID=3363975 RepID=UPI003676E623
MEGRMPAGKRTIAIAAGAAIVGLLFPRLLPVLAGSFVADRFRSPLLWAGTGQAQAGAGQWLPSPVPGARPLSCGQGTPRPAANIDVLVIKKLQYCPDHDRVNTPRRELTDT